MANLAYIQICRVCNQNCRFCSNPPLDKKISLTKAQKLIDKYIESGYEGVIFSGGEPTLYKDLDKLITYVAKKNYPCRIITNGQKTADRFYMRSLVEAGLQHMSLSIYSNNPKVQNFLTENDDSLENIKRTLYNVGNLGITVDVGTVINKYNAEHLEYIVRWIVTEYPFVKHFIWNNIDSNMSRVSQNKDTIPCLSDFELELYKAMVFLTLNKRTFRVERVPLCYMTDFAHCSTETRKIVKSEKRTTYFLDEKGLWHQQSWQYDKGHCCVNCTLTNICAGLYSLDNHFSSRELYPVFVPPQPIIDKIFKDG